MLLNAAAHWFHLFSAIVWIGGLFFYLTVLMPTLKDVDPAAARRLSQIVSVRFRLVAILAFAALLLTGLYLATQVLQGVASPRDFLGTAYGKALAAKLALATVVILLGGVLGFVLAPKLVVAIESRDEARMRALGRAMGIVTGTQFLLGIAITVCVAVLRAAV